MKSRQKTGFFEDLLSPISSKITPTREKEKEKRKKRGGRKEEEEKKKSSGCTLSFYNDYFEDTFWPKKQEDDKQLKVSFKAIFNVHFANSVSKEYFAIQRLIIFLLYE